jgi:hypothetical protein
MAVNVCVFILLLLFVSNAESNNTLHVNELYDKLTYDYNKNILPNFNNGKAVEVNVSFNLVLLDF